MISELEIEFETSAFNVDSFFEKSESMYAMYDITVDVCDVIHGDTVIGEEPVIDKIYPIMIIDNEEQFMLPFPKLIKDLEDAIEADSENILQNYLEESF
jgi:hypothetical protein